MEAAEFAQALQDATGCEVVSSSVVAKVTVGAEVWKCLRVELTTELLRRDGALHQYNLHREPRVDGGTTPPALHLCSLDHVDDPNGALRTRHFRAMCEFKNRSVQRHPDEWARFQPRCRPYCVSEADVWFEFTLMQLLGWWWRQRSVMCWPRSIDGEYGRLLGARNVRLLLRQIVAGISMAAVPIQKQPSAAEPRASARR